MTEKIQVTKDTPDTMRQRSYLFGGSTSDETMLAEIRRDYLATDGKDVAFTRGRSDVSLASLQCQAEARHCQAEVRLTDQAAIRAIVGEAANQSDRVMLAVAGALRNRGTLAGVYGLNAPVTRSSTSAVWARAARAWAQSAQPISQAEVRLAAGCRYFGCPTDAPYFLRTLHFHPVVTIGQITFYKP